MHHACPVKQAIEKYGIPYYNYSKYLVSGPVGTVSKDVKDPVTRVRATGQDLAGQYV